MIRVLGGGPAGSCAAIAAALQGSPVEIIERSRLPRHKVCGEFLSPEIAPVLEKLGVLTPFLAQRPFAVRRMSVHIGSLRKRAILPEPAFGLSRYAFDHLLWSHAEHLGARRAADGEPVIVASGRPPGRPGTRRLFGFKAHFEGPVDDAVELYFFGRAYVGVNCIEQDRTNVCGLAPEQMLRAVDFEPEALLTSSPALQRRLEPLRRAMNWMFVGPLEFGQRWGGERVYRAGDALSFVDPFTGSGLLCAALSGSLAGRMAAQRAAVTDYERYVRAAIAKPFGCASALRAIAGTDWAERLLPWVPASLLFRLTRPR